MNKLLKTGIIFLLSSFITLQAAEFESNVALSNDYVWRGMTQTSEEAAKQSLCGNCVAFDISPRMDDCMPGETSDNDGRLGYCWMHHFKCHSARSCHTWAKGGPITKDEKSYNWQERGAK